MPAGIDKERGLDTSLRTVAHGHTVWLIQLNTIYCLSFKDLYPASPGVIEQELIEVCAPGLEAAARMIGAVVGRARLRTAPTGGVPDHTQEPRRFDLRSRAEEIKNRKNTRSEGFADLMPGEAVLLKQDHAIAETCQESGDRRARRPSSGHDDVCMGWDL